MTVVKQTVSEIRSRGAPKSVPADEQNQYFLSFDATRIFSPLNQKPFVSKCKITNRWVSMSHASPLGWKLFVSVSKIITVEFRCYSDHSSWMKNASSIMKDQHFWACYHDHSLPKENHWFHQAKQIIYSLDAAMITPLNENLQSTQN